MRAAEILLRRLWPERKGCPIPLALPRLRTAADVSTALEVVAGAMSEGAISPDEAGAMGAVIEQRRRAIETQELEERIAALEERTKR